jgi:signal transduction histidine kinase
MDDDGSVVVRVSDTGIGMDQAGTAKAMTMFGQVDSGLDRKFEGTGLGLPLAQGLMEAHGGTLDLKSEKGRGTTVTIRFPKDRWR